MLRDIAPLAEQIAKTYSKILKNGNTLRNKRKTFAIVETSFFNQFAKLFQKIFVRPDALIIKKITWLLSINLSPILIKTQKKYKMGSILPRKTGSLSGTGQNEAISSNLSKKQELFLEKKVFFFF